MTWPTLQRRQRYRVVDGTGFTPGHQPRDLDDATRVAREFHAWVQWLEPETGDWVSISERGGDPLPRSQWRVSLW